MPQSNTSSSKNTLNLSPQNFGDMLSDYRNMAGYTLLKASKASNVPTSIISRLERNDFSPIAAFTQEQCEQIIGNLCTAYQADFERIIQIFNQEFQIFLDNHSSEQFGDCEEIYTKKHERRNISAILISGLVILIILLVAAGWIYQQWVNYQALDKNVVIDYSQYAPEPELPMLRLEIPKN